MVLIFVYVFFFLGGVAYIYVFVWVLVCFSLFEYFIFQTHCLTLNFFGHLLDRFLKFLFASVKKKDCFILFSISCCLSPVES